MGELGMQPRADQEQRVAVADLFERPGDALRLDRHRVEVGVVVAPVLIGPEFRHPGLPRLSCRRVGFDAVRFAIRQQIVQECAGARVDAERDRVLPSDLDRIGLDLDDLRVGRNRLPVDRVDIEETGPQAQHQIGLPHQRVRGRMAEMARDSAGKRMVLRYRAAPHLGGGDRDRQPLGKRL